MNQIKKLRLQNKLKQSDIAEQLGISREAVTQWEACKTFPRRKTLYKLAKVLKCKPADLL